MPMKSTGSCGMTESWLRRSLNPSLQMSKSSINIVPSSGSAKRNNATPREDFPESEREGQRMINFRKIWQNILIHSANAFTDMHKLLYAFYEVNIIF